MDSVPHAARSRKLSHRLARSGLSCLQNLKLLIWDQQSGGSQNPRYRVSVPCSNCVAISRQLMSLMLHFAADHGIRGS